MRSLFLFICSFLFSATLFAQTGIGTTTPDASAKLDVTATNKGFLPPRVTLTSYTDNTTIPNPATGLLIYNTGNNVGLAAGYYYWNGNAWATIATAGGSGSFAASFLRGSKTATQTMAVNDVVTFSQIDNTAGQSISLNTANGKITLAAGNTYRLIATVPNFTGSRPAFMWYNETNSTYIGSSIDGYTPLDGANAGSFSGIAQAIITPNVNTVISFRLVSSLNSGSIITAGNPDFFASGIYPWFEAQVISGNAPVTGQSVDYGIARYTGADAGSLADGSTVAFDAITSGNMSWNSTNNRFTLKANKTYIIEASLGIYAATPSAGRFQIYNFTGSGASLANGLYISHGGSGTWYPNANTPMKCIVTPTTDIQVGIKLEGHYGASPGIIGSANVVTTNGSSNVSYFMVQQIGSSAIVDPWVLSGSNTYNTTGNVGIGNNSPTVALDVTGDTKVSGVLTAGGNTYPTNTGTNGYALTTNASGAASWNAVPPVGVITAFAGSIAPTGYLICDGSAVSRTTYAALYAIIGTTYGAGNGSTTFNIPDLTGRVPVGKNAGTFSTLGAKAGEETHTMTTNEMPAHNHTTKVNSALEGYNTGGIGGYAASTQTMFFGTDRAGTTTNWNTAMQNTGGGAAFNLLQPYTVINYIIKF